LALAKPFVSIPFALGKIAPPAAGTPLRITNNFTDLNQESVSSLFIQALATNTNPVYILGQQAATAKDLAGYSNVIAVLTAGQGIAINGKTGNQATLGNIWVDPTTSGEGVFASIQEI